jgi:hypothetical protein
VPALVRRLLLALTASLLLVPAVAQASWQSVVKDCTTDGKIDQHHSLSDYTQALNHLGSDVIEYTDCQAIIRRAQLVAAGGGAKRSKSPKVSTTAKIARNGNGGSSSGGANPSSSGGPSSSSSGGGGDSTPAPTTVGSDPLASASNGQRSALTHAIKAGGEPVKVGSEVVSPASLGTGSVGSPTSLPPALIVLLVALGIGAVGIGVAAVLPRVRARRAR